ncbi:unnamed protein product [Gongylonema pulchrum]|uniref:Glycine-rich cell wall structural protein 1 n=1 Tax=Gongylonema pulchrum TaxID=637853 RepID=A0A183D5C4_9BILA|nr:unnamed protein product [Gongylonema pulchrum]
MDFRGYSLLQFCMLLLLLVEECGSKRGGVFSGGRGSSSSRSGGLFGGTQRSGGGLFGSSRNAPRPGSYPRSSGGHYGGVPASGGNWGSRTRSGTGGIGGGWGSSARGSSWGRPRSGGLFTKSNIGSFVAGAAAGYLTYKAGKALIRSAYAPMMFVDFFIILLKTFKFICLSEKPQLKLLP